ncbi:MAG: GntR family transcriptional regulator [Rhodospirillales bacterium]|nr:GntR family transcriptional regulator [Rhodospirillales bacterium]
MTGLTKTKSQSSAKDKGGKRRIPLAERAYAEIKRRINDNEYFVGFQALEADLAQEFEMSRTPIREALVQLEKEGLVEIIPRHGMRVLPISVRDMLEIFQLLTYLEALAVDLILDMKAKPETFDPMYAAVIAMEEAIDNDDVEAWTIADLTFHAELLALADNKRLTETIGSFWDQTKRTKRVALFRRSKPQRSTENHRRLLDAIRQGDAKKARKIHIGQRESSHAELLEIIERFDIRHL